MIRRSEEKQSVRKPAPFNGVGEITVRSLLNGPAGYPARFSRPCIVHYSIIVPVLFV